MTVTGASDLLDWPAFNQARAELGVNFARILGYFHEDGIKSVGDIEEAVRAQNAAALVIPAHTLKGEARQFGAEPLAELSETIEMMARDCLEQREAPTHIIPHAAKLRGLFDETLAVLNGAASPLIARRPSFGRRTL